MRDDLDELETLSSLDESVHSSHKQISFDESPAGRGDNEYDQLFSLGHKLEKFAITWFYGYALLQKTR